MDNDTLAACSELRTVARDVLAARATPQHVRALFDDPQRLDRELWGTMAELGWLAIEVPEAFGGMAASFAFSAVILQELGFAAAGGPFLSSAVLATSAIGDNGTDDQRRAWLPRLASGDAIGTVAVAGPWHRDTVRATPEGGGWRLEGAMGHVLDALVADVIVVSASAGDRLRLFLVETASPGVVVEAVDMLDLTRSFASVRLDSVMLGPDAVLGGEEPELEAIATRAGVAAACDSVGIAAKVVDMTATYACERVQFGRPIGSFQAVKHQCADMLVALECSRVIVDAAVDALATGSSAAGSLADMAKLYACRSAADAAGRGIQLHGGIGYTWEHEMHVYLKRAKVNEVVFGDGRWHRERVASSMLGG